MTDASADITLTATNRGRSRRETDRPDGHTIPSGAQTGDCLLWGAIAIALAVDIAGVVTAIALQPRGPAPIRSAVLVCALLHGCSVANAARGRNNLAMGFWLAGPLAGAAMLLQHPMPLTVYALAISLLVATVLACGPLAGRRKTLLVAIGALAFVLGSCGTPNSDPVLLAASAATLLASAVSSVALGPLLRTAIEQTWWHRAIAERLATLEREHQQVLADRERDNERAARLVRMNAELVGVQLQLESNYRVIEEMNAQLERLASTDALTCIPNRRVFEEMLEAQVALSAECGEEVSVILLDVDHFKRYNDTYGHIEGDELLQELASIIRDDVRDTDLATRFGGEEFAVLLPMTGAAQAAALAERLRATIEGHPFEHGPTTVSLGIATTCSTHRDARTLLAAADAALYRAKDAGRNRVVSADEAPAAAPVDTPSLIATPPAHRKRRGHTGPIHVRHSDALGGIEGLVQQPSGTILSALLAALDLRDHETEGHSQRVARYAMRLAVELGQTDEDDQPDGTSYVLDPGDIRDLTLGAMLHDIGKLQVPDAILRKNGPLNDEEWAIMKMHPTVGADLVSRFVDLAPATTVVRYHHERWDGAGYPDKRAGTDIPLVARIFAICDTLDAITSDRPYRRAKPFSAAIDEVRNCRGKQFDPVVVDAFLRIAPREWEMLATGECEWQQLAA